jgi:hypothetical protein
MTGHIRKSGFGSVDELERAKAMVEEVIGSVAMAAPGGDLFYSVRRFHCKELALL